MSSHGIKLVAEKAGKLITTTDIIVHQNITWPTNATSDNLYYTQWIQQQFSASKIHQLFLVNFGRHVDTWTRAQMSI